MTQHMGMTRGFLAALIQERGAKFVMVDWTGTDAELMAELANDPREVYCGCPCKKNPDGSCSGESET